MIGMVSSAGAGRSGDSVGWCRLCLPDSLSETGEGGTAPFSLDRFILVKALPTALAYLLSAILMGWLFLSSCCTEKRSMCRIPVISLFLWR